MAMYAIAMVPLIKKLEEQPATQVWYADDSAAAGRISDLRDFWDAVTEMGPSYGYNPNALKTRLVVKPNLLHDAQEQFSGTGVVVKPDGASYLGSAIGTSAFVTQHAEQQVAKWQAEIRQCAAFASTQPHAAYTLVTKSLLPSFNYLVRTVPCPSEVLRPLDEALTNDLLPALLGHDVAPDSHLRQLLALPTRFGGIALPLVHSKAESERLACLEVISPLVQLRVPDFMSEEQQADTLVPTVAEDGTLSSQPLPDHTHPGGGPSQDSQALIANNEEPSTADSHSRVWADILSTGRRTQKIRKQRNEEGKATARALKSEVTAGQALLVDVASEKGLSSGLTAQPSPQLGTVLNKTDFRFACGIACHCRTSQRLVSVEHQ